jgi:hypothetical protein
LAAPAEFVRHRIAYEQGLYQVVKTGRTANGNVWTITREETQRVRFYAEELGLKIGAGEA